jgi:signal transduction histidine kinase
MQERVEHLAGKLEVKSQPGLGTAVLFTLPVPGGPLGAGARVFDLAIDAHRAS